MKDTASVSCVSRALHGEAVRVDPPGSRLASVVEHAYHSAQLTDDVLLAPSLPCAGMWGGDGPGAGEFIWFRVLCALALRQGPEEGVRVAEQVVQFASDGWIRKEAELFKKRLKSPAPAK